MIKLFIADDHYIVRAGLKTALMGMEGIAVVGETDNGVGASEKIRASGCTFVLLDINMPGKDGFDVLAEIRAAMPRLPVLMISLFPEQQYAMRAIRAGANGYLMKNCEPAQLIDAIRRIVTGERYVSPQFASNLVEFLAIRGETPSHLLLSEREYQIFELIVKGRPLTEIGDMLCISQKTVSTYRARVLEKMHLSTNADLVRYAVEHSLFPA